MAGAGVQTLKDGYAAFARGDIDGVLAAFDEEIEWIESEELPFGGTYGGHNGVLQFFSALQRHWSELSVEPQEFITEGDRIVVVARIQGTGAGGRMDLQAIHLWRMRDGKALEFREFADTAAIQRALGTPAVA